MSGGFSRAMAAAAASLGVTLAVACVTDARPEDAEDAESFRQDVMESADAAGALLEQTKRGRNISEIGMGLFAMTVLNELTTRDAELSGHIHADGRSTDLYLREVFQSHPTEEIAAVRAMSGQGERRTLRLAAGHVLEALLHIPTHEESAAAQDADRQQLAEQLTDIETLLQQAAAEVKAAEVKLDH